MAGALGTETANSKAHNTKHPTAASQPQKKQNYKTHCGNWGDFTEFGLGLNWITLHCLGYNKQENKEHTFVHGRGFRIFQLKMALLSWA